MDCSSGAGAAIWQSFRRRRFLFAAGLAVLAFHDMTPVFASSVFASGPFTLPEGITGGLGGTYLLSDADNDEVYSIPAGGGAVTTGTALGFRVFGEIALPSGYSQAGQYFAYGTVGNGVGAVAALTGISGLNSPTTVISTTNGFFTTAAVAPADYGSIRAGQVVVANDPGGVGSSTPSTIEVCPAMLRGPLFSQLCDGSGRLWHQIRPGPIWRLRWRLVRIRFGTGNLYLVDSTGDASLFATLPLPERLQPAGLRQIAWAPPGFTLPGGEDIGGDLFVSIAAQNGGGGSTGEIDVLDASGNTVAHYLVGGGSTPLDPRGLFFIDNATLLVANADPGVQQLAPSDSLRAPPSPSLRPGP